MLELGVGVEGRNTRFLSILYDAGRDEIPRHTWMRASLFCLSPYEKDMRAGRFEGRTKKVVLVYGPLPIER